MKVNLMDHQKEALRLLGNGKVLWGGVGSGKSAVAMAYYIENESPRDVYVITTAKKRDSLDWEGEGARFGVGTNYDSTTCGVLTVDSWNNVGNYTDVKDAFFIFDEQRVVGHGAWVKSFIKISKSNRWIMLSATPGDTWIDYAPLFIANRWYRNITDFKRQHVVYAPYVKFPIIDRYLGEQRLERHRSQILVEMPFIRHTTRFMNYILCGYDEEMVKWVMKNRWHPYEDRPLRDAGDMFRLIRTITNSDRSRLEAVRMVMKMHDKVIIFYNFDYELEILRELANHRHSYGEYNGHVKDPIPNSDKWVYVVQYQAGSEGWNCIDTDCMVLYSLTYSYKNYIQAQGRIDRLNTPFTNLYYYIIESLSPIDIGVKRSLGAKKSFNERNSEFYRQISGDRRDFAGVLS